MSERQTALSRLSSGDGRAVDHLDPHRRADVMAWGLVGSRQGGATVASPMHKQSYDLVTGECLDDAAFSLPVRPPRVVDGAVEVQVGALEGVGAGAA
ncbi:MAG: nitrite reductase (NAD(P)H) small subunit [Aeromicrobium sp.]